jgi:hypothetical protein
MLDKDQILLERAYLTLSKVNTPNLDNVEPEEEETEEIVSASPVSEPAPGIDMEMVDDEDSAVSSEENDTTGIPVDMEQIADTGASHNAEEEHEEDEMAIDNLNSIRESIFKIASFCASGGHLETWQQQKLAIAMDNLAGVARSLR